ncbi:hypothetical protein WME91_12490 [Sorangium sp. So ce269]
MLEYNAETCDRRLQRASCIQARPGRGSLVRIGEDEPLQHHLRKLVAAKKGRAQLSARVGIEHRLAHHVQRQGRRARDFGMRVNPFGLRGAAALQNLEAIQ